MIQEQTTTPFKVGDILCSSWGYDQTNICFYQVLSVTKASLRVREIRSAKAAIQDRLPYETAVVPLRGEFIKPSAIGNDSGRVLTRRITKHNGIKLSMFEYAYKWDEKEKYKTTSGYGH